MDNDKQKTILVIAVILCIALLSTNIITYMKLREVNTDKGSLQKHTWMAIPHYATNGTNTVLGISIMDEQTGLYLSEVWVHYKNLVNNSTVNGTGSELTQNPPQITYQYLNVYSAFSQVPWWFTYNYTLVDEDLTRTTYNITQLRTWLEHPDLVRSDNMQAVNWEN